MKRGRKPQPCPDPHELRVAYAFDPRLVVVARQMDSNPKTVRRWLGELGIVVPAPKKIRRHGGKAAWAAIADRAADGKRVYTRLYNVWLSMRKRCLVKTCVDYKRYGGRGITICAAWNEYATFRAWAISSGYRKGLTLDREDSEGNYTPDNCRWVTKAAQQFNTRRVNRLTIGGITKSLPEWAREYGIPAGNINSRLRSGWSHERAVTTPLGATRQRPLFSSSSR